MKDSPTDETQSTVKRRVPRRTVETLLYTSEWAGTEISLFLIYEHEVSLATVELKRRTLKLGLTHTKHFFVLYHHRCLETTLRAAPPRDVE